MTFVGDVRVSVGVFAQLYSRSEPLNLGLDERLCKRNHLDWKRELAQALDLLCRIAEHDASPRYRGNIRFSQKRSASTFDHFRLGLDLVADVYIDADDGLSIKRG